MGASEIPWFKVDDTLHSHPKARRAGLAAMGLWSIAGSYAAQYVTEGFVPDWFVTAWPSGRKLAATLTGAGLWSPGEQDGEQGWRFHDWAHFQPSKEEVERDRAHTRERQRRYRERQRAGRDSASRNGVTDPVTNAVSNDAPSRPVPTVVDGSVREDRDVPARAGRATDPPTCQRHPNGNPNGEKCAGCAKVREWDEAQTERERHRVAAERLACPDCDDTGMILDPSTLAPVRRCQHRRAS